MALYSPFEEIRLMPIQRESSSLAGNPKHALSEHNAVNNEIQSERHKKKGIM
jgi:hypothetical protein